MADDIEEFEDQLQQEQIAKHSEQDDGYDASRYYQDEDGTYYEFDSDRRAWIPMINDEFIAQYNLSYGSFAGRSENASNQDVSHDDAVAHSSTSASASDSFSSFPSATNDLQQQSKANSKASESADKSQKRKPTPSEPAWFDIQENKNTNVYVTGLPFDITEDEYLALMNKVGLVASDPITRKLKLKLYKNSDGTYKGDGRCCYLKPESVELALSILDGSDVRGNTISVERAKFEMKGQYDPTKKRRKLTKQEKKKAEEKQKWLLGWEPDKKADGRPHFEKTVVIKHAFSPKQIEESPDLLLELTEDFRDECKKFGDVKKVLVCDRHEEGVVLVTFRTPEEADACIAAVHRRWFGGQQLDASTYDGRTKYHVKETEDEREARIKKWNEFLQDSKSSSQSEVPKQEESNDSKVDVNKSDDLAPTNVDDLDKSSVMNSDIIGSNKDDSCS